MDAAIPGNRRYDFLRELEEIRRRGYLWRDPELTLAVSDRRPRPYTEVVINFTVTSNERGRVTTFRVDGKAPQRFVDGVHSVRIQVGIDPVRVELQCDRKTLCETVTPNVTRPSLSNIDCPRNTVEVNSMLNVFADWIDAEAIERKLTIVREGQLDQLIARENVAAQSLTELLIDPQWFGAQLRITYIAKAAFASLTDRAVNTWTRLLDIVAPPVSLSVEVGGVYINSPACVTWHVSGAEQVRLLYKPTNIWYDVPAQSYAEVTLKTVDPHEIELHARGYDGGIKVKYLALTVGMAAFHDDDSVAKIYDDDPDLNDLYEEYDA